MSKFVGGTAAALAVAFLLCAGAVVYSEDTDAVTLHTGDDGVIYELNGTTAAVSGYVDGKLPSDGKLSIPATITVKDVTYDVTAIDAGAFSKCTALTAVSIPDSITSIAIAAFRNCSSLTSVTIPDSVITIGINAFYKCTALTSLTLGEKMTALNYNTFYGCTSLTSVTIPASVTSYYASFGGCTALTAFTVADGNTAFCAVNGILYSKDMSTLFQCPGSFTSVTIPDSVTIIANGAFDSGKLTAASIPDSVTTVSDRAFYTCTALTSLTLGQNVETIGFEAFYKCTSLTAVTIPASVASYDAAFGGCTALTAFTVADGNKAFCAVDGVLYSKDLKTLVQCPGSFTAVAIPAGVTAIAEEAFDSGKLTTVSIPDSVTGIGDFAFFECTDLMTMYLGSGIAEIGLAFDYNFYAADGTELVGEKAIAGHCYKFVEADSGDKYVVYDGNLVNVTGTNGTVTGGGLYAADTDVTITATAADGYSFAGWYSNGVKVTDDASYTFKLDGNPTYTAQFTKNAEPSGGSTWIWIAVIVVVILVVLLAVYFLFIRTGKLKL